jgi:hypothetical protein
MSQQLGTCVIIFISNGNALSGILVFRDFRMDSAYRAKAFKLNNNVVGGCDDHATWDLLVELSHSEFERTCG